MYEFVITKLNTKSRLCEQGINYKLCGQMGQFDSYRFFASLTVIVGNDNMEYSRKNEIIRILQHHDSIAAMTFTIISRATISIKVIGSFLEPMSYT